MRKTLFFIFFVLLAAALSLPSFAASLSFDDRVGLLDEAAERRLEAQISALETDLCFGVITRRGNSHTDALSEEHAAMLCGLDREQTAILLAVTLFEDTYYYDIYTLGEADRIFSQRNIDAILDHPEVYDNLKSGKVEQGAAAFLRESNTVYGDHLQSQAKKQSLAPLYAVLFGLVIGALAAGASVLGVALFYRRKKRGDSYPLGRYANLSLTQSHDRFVGSFVTRVRVQSSGSSSSRSGGGGSRGRR